MLTFDVSLCRERKLQLPQERAQSWQLLWQATIYKRLCFSTELPLQLEIESMPARRIQTSPNPSPRPRKVVVCTSEDTPGVRGPMRQPERKQQQKLRPPVVELAQTQRTILWR